MKQKLLSLFLLLTPLLIIPGNCWGQTTTPPPDCVYFINAVLTGGSAATISYPAAGFDNRTLGCQTWTVFYTATATSGTITSLDFQSAGGAVVAGSWATWGATVSTGINPNTSSVTATSTFATGCLNAAQCNAVNSWTKLLLTRNNFVGTIRGVVMGYRSGYPGGGGSGGGGLATDVNLKQVGGVATVTGGLAGSQGVGGLAAPGAVPVGNPVAVAGTDGTDIRTVSTDSAGKVNVNTFAAQPANSTATWTNATAGNTALAVPLTGYANVTLSYVNTGSVTGGVITFEVTQDGTNWLPISVAPIVGTSTLSATWAVFVQASNAWQMYVGGFNQFRIRLSTVITGTGSVAVTITPTASATEFSAIVGQSVATNLQAQVEGFISNKGVVGTPAVLTAGWDGSLGRIILYCPNSAVISTSSMGNTKIVSLSGTTNIYVCQISLSNASGVNIKFLSGTNVSGPCDTTPVTLTGTYQNVLTAVLPFGSTSPLTVAAGKDLCINLGAGVDVEGTISYAQF
jgi:hypothetical protein